MAYNLLLTPAHIRNFWIKVEKGFGPDDCWTWTGWKNASGHPRFDVSGQKILATHLALILTGQPRPKPPHHFALHGDTCVSPSCVNPSHLRWGSALQNTEDRDRLGRRTALRGEGHPMSRLDEHKVRLIRASELSSKELGRELGVSSVTVNLIRKRKAWAHVS